MQSIVMELAKRIYDGEKITYDPDLLHHTAKPLVDGIQKGYGKSIVDVEYNSPDYKALVNLTRNAFQFSASKDFHILQDMTNALRDGDRVRSFGEFRAEVDRINVKYNQNWLRTEYNQAIAASQATARWQEFQENAKAMPFLQYQAVMDASTRPDHQRLHGVIKRIDNPFWNTHFPPLGWGCRCEVIQLPGKNHKETPDGSFQKPDVPPQFRENFGKEQKLFSDKHPYYQNKCQGCNGTPQSLALNPQCEACVAGQKEGGKVLNGYKKNTQWKSQGRKWEDVANDNNYKPIKGEKNIYAPEGRSSEKDYLDKLITARVAVEHGYRVWILGKTGKRNPDYLFERDGIFHPYDLKRVQSIYSLEQDLIKSQGQTNRVIIKINRTGNPRIIINSIRKYFEQVPEAQEVLIFQGKRPISIERNFFEQNKKVYIKEFLKLWK